MPSARGPKGAAGRPNASPRRVRDTDSQPAKRLYKFMSNPSSTGVLTQESLLSLGRSVRLLAMTVILLLTLGLVVIAYGELRQRGPLVAALEDPGQLLGGFVFLMVLTVSYLGFKSWATTRYQRRLIERLLEEEAINRARALNPITQFHHPEVCRDILLRHASYAGRLHVPLSILELTVPNLAKLATNSAGEPVVEDLIRQVRRLHRPIDCLLRWSPDSFLLVFAEVGSSQLPVIRERLHQAVDIWSETRFEEAARPEIRWRGITTDTLGETGDILLEVQGLLENRGDVPVPPLTVPRPRWQREKSVALAMELDVSGVDGKGSTFQERVVTERVASDRIWFLLDKDLSEQTPLKVASPSGDLQQTAMVTYLIPRAEGQLVEAQFSKTPDRWVVRTA